MSLCRRNVCVASVGGQMSVTSSVTGLTLLLSVFHDNSDPRLTAFGLHRVCDACKIKMELGSHWFVFFVMRSERRPTLSSPVLCRSNAAVSLNYTLLSMMLLFGRAVMALDRRSVWCWCCRIRMLSSEIRNLPFYTYFRCFAPLCGTLQYICQLAYIDEINVAAVKTTWPEYSTDLTILIRSRIWRLTDYALCSLSQQLCRPHRMHEMRTHACCDQWSSHPSVTSVRKRLNRLTSRLNWRLFGTKKCCAGCGFPSPEGRWFDAAVPNHFGLLFYTFVSYDVCWQCCSLYIDSSNI